MAAKHAQYLWEQPGWPHWRFDTSALAEPLARANRALGLVLGRVADVGLPTKTQAALASLTEDVLRTSEIEGERLNVASVRSSLARRLGVDIGALAPADRHVDGVVEMVLDATMHATEELTEERLFGWHAALFPTGRSALQRIRVGAWREDASGAMQVVSGDFATPTVHFEAPPARRLAKETARFLKWANAGTPEDPLLKAGLAHLWFVTLHPFDDGNGRIARAIGDWLLARADQSPQRYYSLSAQIQRERASYYEVLERTQKGTLDVTDWLGWFLTALTRALDAAQHTLDAVLEKARFWHRWAGTPLNPRQIKVLNRLLDGFEGPLTTRKWAALTRCSSDTALRDITELVERGLLERLPAGGRSTGYALVRAR